MKRKDPREKERRIKITKNGPYLLSGKIPISKGVMVADANGDPEKWKEEGKIASEEECSLCRCGKSSKKPFCTGAHLENGFDGTETASTHDKFMDDASVNTGPDLILLDNEKLCIGAGFCHRKGGTWDLTEHSDVKECRDLAIEQCSNCPSGRLVALDKKTRKPIETIFNPSIVLIEHPKNLVSGPLWIRGDITIESAKGKEYEKRNRVTLCRCGNSSNKPFCDGTHIDINFKDSE